MKRDEIVRYLKNRILSEEIAPGSFLPLRSDLIRECEASNVTVQNAINRLAAEGFLRSCGSKGVMVSVYPPHKYRVGVLLPASGWPEKNFDTKWFAVEQALDMVEKDGSHISFERYRVSKEMSMHDDELKKLSNALNESLLAGVIVPFSLPDGLLMPLNGYPVVQHEPRNAKVIRAVSFNHNYIAMAEMAVKKLLECGATKIAVIMGSEMPAFFIREIEKVLFNCKEICTKKEWIQSLSNTSRGIVWAENLLRLVFAPELRERPDGLVVLNENLLNPVTESLHELDMIIGKDIHVCSHSNIPTLTPVSDKIHFLAFDWCEIFRKSIWCINRFHKLDESYFGREFLLPPKILDQFAPQPFSDNVNLNIQPYQEVQNEQQ